MHNVKKDIESIGNNNNNLRYDEYRYELKH